MVLFTERRKDMKTRPSSPSIGVAFLDGPISADYRPVMDMSMENTNSCGCSDSCFVGVPKPDKKKAQDLSGWSIPPPLAQAPELRV